MMSKKKKVVAEFVECMRFQRCDAVGCDVREWHRHKVGEAEGLRVLGAPEPLEPKLDPPTEPEPQPPPPTEPDEPQPVTEFED